MFAALLLLMAAPQDVPAAPDEDVEEIVVRATFGNATMLFDKGVDGKLRNCRIMVSTGSQKRDAEACRATPVCYAGTADTVTDCISFAVIDGADLADPRAMARAAAPEAKSDYQVFALKPIIEPTPPPPGAIGPYSDTTESRDTQSQRVKLPKLPQADTDGPVIRITNGNTPQR